MQQLSSSWTMPLKLFLPAFFGGILGAFFVIVWFYNVNAGPLSTLRIISLSLLVIAVAVYYIWIRPLKRIDADSQYFYISNYLKTLRYSLDSIENVVLNTKGTRGKIVLKESGAFGKVIPFLASGPRVKQYLESNTIGSAPKDHQT